MRPRRRAGVAAALLALLAFAALAGHAAAFISFRPSGSEDPYKVLGVRRSATQREITQAFRRLSRQWHPDKNPSPEATEQFQRISAAYEQLSDPARVAQVPWEFGSGRGTHAQKAHAAGQGGFTAFTSTVHIVMDLDPFRMLQLARSWAEAQASKHSEQVLPLWRAPVDEVVCRGLEAGWKLPSLLEPAVLAFEVMARQGQGPMQLKPGMWRAWRVSGVLLELSAWVGRQEPCLRHHTGADAAEDDEQPAAEQDTAPEQEESPAAAEAAGAPAGGDALARLTQQLRIRRELRQQQLRKVARQRQKWEGKPAAQASGRGASAEPVDSGAAPAAATSAGAAVWPLLLAASCWLLLHGWQLPAAAAAVVAGAVWAVPAGGLVPNEAAVQALAALLQAGGWQAGLAGAAYVSVMAVLFVLLPLLALRAAAATLVWLWAVLTCLSLALTPCMGRTGLALWVVLKAWGFFGGNLVRGAVLMLGAGIALLRAPRLLLLWVYFLISPLLLLGNFAKCAVQANWYWWRVRRARAGKAAAQGTAGSGSDGAAAPAGAPGAGTPAKPVAGKRTLLPDGPWWPGSFEPHDLAYSAHFYAFLLGWWLPSKVLAAAGISAKLTYLCALLCVAAAALGAPAPAIAWVSLERLVNTVLLRGGLLAGACIEVRRMLQ